MTLQRYTKTNIIIDVWQTLFARQIDQFFPLEKGVEKVVFWAIKVELGDFSPGDLDFFSKGLIPWEFPATEEIISFLDFCDVRGVTETGQIWTVEILIFLGAIFIGSKLLW